MGTATEHGDPGGSSERPSVVLVVDDDPIVRRLVHRGLEALACDQILEVEDGIAAQRLLREMPVDVVVTDVMMPGLDGLELMRWAREHCPGPAWVILSGLDTFGAAVEAIKLGAFDFLAKPPELERLRVAVRNALDRKQLLREREALTQRLQARGVALEEKVGQLQELCRILEDQSEVIHRDLQRAEIIQRALLPTSPPPLDGFAVESLYRPGRHVGGDLYDVFPVDDRHVVLLLADASGHGVSAAMLSVLFKYRLRTVDDRTGEPLSPGDVLAGINRTLLADVSAPGMFVTAAYGLLDTFERTLVVASAGHPALLWIGADGHTREIQCTGPALGLSPEARFEERTLELAPGDRLFIYTDGVSEGLAGGEPLAARLSEAVRGQVPNREILATLFSEVVRNDDDDRDDITILVLQQGAEKSHFDNALETHAPPARRRGPQLEISWGDSEGSSFLRVAGRATWMRAPAFYETASALLDARRPLRIDLAACAYLDSTFLGTIHEIVGQFQAGGVPVGLQGATPELRGLFEELQMELVLGAMRTSSDPLPSNLQPIETAETYGKRGQLRVLRAHEVLSSLNEHARDQFQEVVASLRVELDRA